MADVKINPVFEGFSKQIGDLVFVQSNGKTFVRRKGNPGNPKTLSQMGVRNSLSILVKDWASLKGIMHEGWKEWAKKKKKKGNNLFVSENFQNQRTGLPIQLFRPVGNLKLKSFTAETGGSGEIFCNYSIEGSTSGRYICFFIKKQMEGMALGEIIIHSEPVAPSSPFTITGLEPTTDDHLFHRGRIF